MYPKLRKRLLFWSDAIITKSQRYNDNSARTILVRVAEKELENQLPAILLYNLDQNSKQALIMVFEH